MDIFLLKASIVGHSMIDDLNDFCITISGGEFSLCSLVYGAEEEKHPKSAIPSV